MLKLVELPGFERRKPTQISGGQAQRVALARALINRPAVLLLDEPLGALDLKLRKQMQVELKRIQQEVGITFIFVTHDQEEAMTMSDRIAVMNHGRYEQLGDPASLYERPRTRFVAGFLGVSNLLPTTPEGSDGDYAVSRLADGTAVRVPAALTEGLDAYEIGVRPEKIRLLELDDAVPDGVNQMLGHRPRRVVPRRVHQLHRRDARRRDGHRLRAERRARDPGRAVGAGRGGPARLVADPHLRRRGRRRAAARRRRSPASWPPAARRSRHRRRPGVSRRKFVVGGAIAVVAVGFGAFLASTAGSGTKPAPVEQRGARPHPPHRRQPPRPQRRPPPAPPPRPAATSPIASLPPATGTLRFANWEGYMDIDEETNDVPDPRALHQGDRDRGRVRRGHRRQRDVLHVEPGRTARARACRPSGTSSS